MRRKSFSFILLLLLFAMQIGTANAQAETQTPIKHFVVMMQENHTFDNYFGTYPGADGFPEGIQMPVDPNDPSAGYVEPWHLGNTTITDLSHSESTYEEQINGGEMNGFVSAQPGWSGGDGLL
jgi:phospholipase C